MNIFFLDDRQIVEISAHKEYINDYYNNNGYTIVTIYDYKKKSIIFKKDEPFTNLESKSKLLSMLSNNKSNNEESNDNNSISSSNTSNSSNSSSSYSVII